MVGYLSKTHSEKRGWSEKINENQTNCGIKKNPNQVLNWKGYITFNLLGNCFFPSFLTLAISIISLVRTNKPLLPYKGYFKTAFIFGY